MTGLFLTLGVASYSKSVLIPALLLVLTFCYFASGTFLPRLRETVGRYWHGWAVLGDDMVEGRAHQKSVSTLRRGSSSASSCSLRAVPPA